MKIVLCGSLNFAEEILRIKEQLASKGHETLLPTLVERLVIKNSKDAEELKSGGRYLKIKPAYMKEHFDKILESDAILVVNLEKNGIKNYIGGNTFAEIMFAFYHNKKIFLLNPIPEHEKLSCISEEIESIRPLILNGNIELINR